MVWAKQFFNNAQDFYQSKIQDLLVPKNNRIRVAVLDTGVDEESTFWRGACRIRKMKGSPIRETKSFVGAPIDDELGHGTNVAAIILKIAPESDLYIAKISRGPEAEGTQQIIEARFSETTSSCRCELSTANRRTRQSIGQYNMTST